METFSVWHWVMLLVIIGVPVALIAWFARRSASGDRVLVGFGGWLLLLAIGQTLAPFRTIAETGKVLEETYDQLMMFPNGQVVLYGELAITAAFLALQLVTIVLMYRKSRLFRPFFVYQWLAIPVAFVLELLLVSTALDMPLGPLFAAAGPEQTLAAFIITGLWVWYLFKSVRVRNTFDQSAELKQVFA